MNIAESCRHWAAEMHRAASAVEEQSDGSAEVLQIIDGNRAIATTLDAAADVAEAAIKLLKGAGDGAMPPEFAVDRLHEVDGWALERLRATINGGAA